MKKGIVLIMMSLLLVACGNGEDKGKEEAEKPTKENTTETLKLSDAEQYKPEGEFKGKHYKTKKFEVDFQKMSRVEMTGFDNKKFQAIAIGYEVTNKSDEKISAIDAWIKGFNIYQEVDGKDEELEVTPLLDDSHKSEYDNLSDKKIKKGGKYKAMILFKLENTSDPIIIEGTNENHESLGKQKFNLDEFNDGKF
ncbi:DUF5067 domain-containing protein [Staphylococcus agnetis]|uniref:DUF5067 domain-containing protein n=1 Tax=Staphylococcus agnetis TaxID=985762 RepID=UPI000D1AEC85|nr:DUF5067 domain-containing protein [Staphylococcus agnetis]NJH65272.1 DUF5067 domain-containing protein [Staphylococcus agnetis]NJH97690.1 DUF5067 domain-containing protein [Staphylococcus agnetis]PTH45408.1 hypothetical protein BU587_10390 [Staphylococcus agnetis]PTH71465.1 hypothetical protein BU580_11415 [Staphylococcus agnetis]PTH72093.1 hypothetical protein BU581_09480 [Staphylococcus agnetis]